MGFSFFAYIIYPPPFYATALYGGTNCVGLYTKLQCGMRSKNKTGTKKISSIKTTNRGVLSKYKTLQEFLFHQQPLVISVSYFCRLFSADPEILMLNFV